jgi:hypothetical protein
MVCLPAIAATAYFIAVILLDLYNRNWKQIPGHALFGVFAVLLVLFICQRASESVAWILLAAPLGFVLVGYLASLWVTSPKSDNIPVDPPSNQCPCCSYKACRCRRPCWRPKPKPDCPKPDCPKPEPKPKPDNCIKPSLDE